jgi:tetratricopeptide (TPR) repeat protein
VNPILESLPKRLGLVVSRRDGFALCVWGEAGLGKSHFLDQVMQNLACRGLQVQANSSGPMLARSLPRQDRIPAWASRAIERLEAGETLESAQLADAITANLLASAPFVLRLEDLHEANPAQLEVWASVAQALKGARGVALLAAGRNLPPAGFEQLRLEPLDLQASRLMLEAQTGAALPAAALDWIQARANGNPLFTLEYFRFLARSGFLWSDALRWRWRDPGAEVMPTSVEALVVQAIEPLRHDPLLEATLRARAILPDDHPERWAAVAELSKTQLAKARARLEVDGVLREGGFAQPIVAATIRSTLEPLERRELARRAIRALSDDLPVVAANLVDDADLEPDEAVDLLERGAAASTDRQAAQFLVQITERVGSHERAKRSLLAAQALRHFDTDEALRLVILAGALEPSDDATLLEAELLAAQGRFHEAERCAKRLGAASQLRWLEVLLEARYRLDDDAGVLEVWEGNPGLRAQAGIALRVRVGYALTQLGRYAQARALYADMLEAEPSAEDRAWLLGAAAIVELDAGDLKLAARGFSEALEAFNVLGDLGSEMRSRRVAALANRSAVQYRLGNFTQAIHDLELVLAHHSETGDGRSFAEAQSKLGTYLIAQAEFERAEEVLLEARGVLERISAGGGGNPRALSLAEQGLVQLYLEWGPPHGAALALRHAQAAERAARQVQNPANLTQTLFYVAWAEAVHGRPERARTMSEELEGLAHDLQLEVYGGLTDWVRGLALIRLGLEHEGLERIDAACGQMRTVGHAAYAQRLALEADRFRDDLNAVRGRLPDLELYPGWRAVAQRYFPQIAEVGQLEVGKPEISQPGIGKPGISKPGIGKPVPVRSESANARLSVLGSLRLEVNHQTITPPAMQGKILLALLLEARVTGREGVKALELLDALYPEHEESMGLGALKQLVFRLRNSLGKSTILRISDGYALGTLETDAEAFLESAATHLWRGPVLQDLPEDIATSLRDALAQALRLNTERLLESDPLEAARLAEIMRESDPYDHKALHHQLRALEIAADLRKLERTYAQAREQLREVGENLPESWQSYFKASFHQV